MAHHHGAPSTTTISYSQGDGMTTLNKAVKWGNTPVVQALLQDPRVDPGKSLEVKRGHMAIGMQNAWSGVAGLCGGPL